MWEPPWELDLSVERSALRAWSLGPLPDLPKGTERYLVQVFGGPEVTITFTIEGAASPRFEAYYARSASPLDRVPSWVDASEFYWILRGELAPVSE